MMLARFFMVSIVATGLTIALASVTSTAAVKPSRSSFAESRLYQATPLPVAYVTDYYAVGNNYVTQVNSFNTGTARFNGTIATMPGFTEGATLSGDGKELYVTLPLVSASSPNQPGTLNGYAVSPTAAAKNASVSYPYGQFSLAYAGLTSGPAQLVDLFRDLASSSVFDLTTIGLARTKYGPSVASAVQYAVVAPGTGLQNSYVLDRAGNFRVYNSAANTFSRPITGIINGLGVSSPTLAVGPNGSTVYALAVSRQGSGSSTVAVINPTTVSVVKKISIPLPCYQLTLDQAKQHLYAMCETFANNTLAYRIVVISPSTNAIQTTLPFPDSTIAVTPSLAVTPDGKYLLLTASPGSSSASLDVVNSATGALAAKVPLPSAPGGALVTASQVFTAP